jgi:hypothetical protein
MNSHLWWVHAYYSPQLVERWTCVSLPLLSHTPHRRSTGGSSGATQRGVWLDLGGISQLTLWRQGWTLVCFIFIFYFVRLPLCYKYSDYIVTFISIHSVIICVVFFGAYMRCSRLCPLNPGVTGSSNPLDHLSRWQGWRPSHTSNQWSKGCTYKNYVTNKVEYTNTQLDMPGVRSLLLYL